MSLHSLRSPIHARHARSAFVAILVALALGALACGPVTPPPESASSVIRGASVDAPPLLASAADAPASDTEQALARDAREKGLYPYNLPHYDGAVADELERAIHTTPDASP
jgi:hypothetical protein